LSSLSKNPSPSVSGQGQPASFGPATVGHLSSLSATHLYQHQDNLSMQLNQIHLEASSLSAIPSPSVSGQPFNAAKPNTSGQAFRTILDSISISIRTTVEFFKPATSGQASSLSYVHHRQYLFLQI
jgi:hypothetical protein